MLFDFTFMKTSGEFAALGEIPEVADRFSVSLVMLDRDSQMIRVLGLEEKTITPYVINEAAKFMDDLNIDAAEILGDDEHAIRVTEEWVGSTLLSGAQVAPGWNASPPRHCVRGTHACAASFL